MAKYKLHWNSSVGGTHIVETDETDPEKILEVAYTEGFGGLCAHCAGWGQNYSRSEGEEVEYEMEDGSPVIYTEDGERYVAPEEEEEDG